jgi:hypothetical protein
MTPAANKLKTASLGLAIVLRVHIEETNLLDRLASGILRQRTDIENSETGAVVALVGVPIVNELVVVGAVGGGLEVAGLLGVAQVADVPEVCRGVAVAGGASAAVLVVLVVKDKEFLPVGIGDPALVDVYIVVILSAYCKTCDVTPWNGAATHNWLPRK